MISVNNLNDFSHDFQSLFLPTCFTSSSQLAYICAYCTWKY